MDIILIGIILFVLVYFVLWACYSMTPIGKKNFENSFKEVPMFHLQGIKDLQENTLIQARIAGNSILFRSCDKDSKQIGISLNDISDAKFYEESEIIESDRSVITRAITGGLFFGVVGAIVGGMSGLQKNKQEKITNLVKIFFKDDTNALFAPFLNSADIAKTFVNRINGEYSENYTDEKPILISLLVASLIITICLLCFICGG